jgi:hypothetical protein
VQAQTFTTSILAKLATMIRYHRKGIRTDWRSRCAGRPETAAEIRDLIRRMNSANPLWRAPRIQGELLKFAIAVNQPTIRWRSLKRRRQAWAPGGRLSHSWSRFRDRFSRASDRTCPGKARGTRDRHVTFSTVSRSANMQYGELGDEPFKRLEFGTTWRTLQDSVLMPSTVAQADSIRSGVF